MKQLKAFFVALILAVISMIGLHFYARSHLQLNQKQFGVWTSDAKFTARQPLLANQDAHTMLIMGSSEFRNATGSPYHIKRMFADTDFTPILIGRDSYQSIHHALTLASIGNELSNKKVVLIVSPQWFQRRHVDPAAFTLRFSETHYLGMLENTKLSEDTKDRLIKRTKQLLSDESMLARIELYNTVYQDQDAGMITRIESGFFRSFIREKDCLRAIACFKADSLSPSQKDFLPVAQAASNDLMVDRDYDWNTLYTKAETAAKAACNNPLYESQAFYNKHKNSIKKAKGSQKDKHYVDGAEEYSDMALFLDVCRDLQITPLLVILPNNGYWLDYTQYPKDERQKTYQAIKDVASGYDVQIADFTDMEYEKYLFTDNFHFSGKGWVRLNEAIYGFYKQNESAP